MKPARMLAIVVLWLLALSGTAHAETADQVAQALRNGPVYQAPGLDLLDGGVLRDELQGSDPAVYVAVLPASDATTGRQAVVRADQIGRALGDRDAVVLVITSGRTLGAAAGSGARQRGVDANRALQTELANVGDKPFDKDTVTAFVLSFKEQVAQQASGDGATSSGGDGGGNGGAALLGGLVVLGGGAAALAVVTSRRRKGKVNEGLRADVEQLYHRLGSDVGTLAPGDSPVARQALADAAERYNATGAALASADAPSEFAAARRTAVEGLTAARVVRKELGLDPGPEIPPPPGTGPQLESDTRVAVGDQVYEGSPTYQPGRQHYYGGGEVGGQVVRGGWYSAPFWEPFLLGAILSGGLGGGLFGGGTGFERGYEAGRDDADDGDQGGGGGDWGGGGGGDWGGGGGGGGGGDWGGGGGGGDGGDGGSW